MTRYSKSLWTRRGMLGAGAAALAAPAIMPRRAWAQGNEIRLGWVSPTTGPISAFGSADDYILAGVQQAIGDGVEINGTTYPVRFIRKDTQSNPNRAAEVASELILDDEVHLMLSSSTADTVLPVTDQCELNEVPSLSTDTPWDAFFFARGGDPAVGFDWTNHFFWGGQQIVDCYSSLWNQLDTNRRVGILLSNDSDGVALSDPITGFPGDAILCGGQRVQMTARSRFQPIKKLYFTLQYRHEWQNSLFVDTTFSRANDFDDDIDFATFDPLDEGDLARIEANNRLRQDINAFLSIVAKPVDPLRLRARVRWYWEDIADNSRLENSVWTYLEVQYKVRPWFVPMLRYDVYAYVDTRDSTATRRPNPEHWIRLQLQSRF